MKPREIDLIDLFVEILLQWRKIIVFMLVGAILFAGFGYVRSQRTYQEQKTEGERLEARLQELQALQTSEDGTEEIYPEKQWLEEQLTEAEIAGVNAVIKMQEYRQKRQSYWEQSVLNRVDALMVPTAELTFHISADTKEDAYDIQKAYEDLFTSGDFYEYLAKEQESLSAAQIKEIVALERSSYGMLMGTDLVSLYMINVDQHSCEKLAEEVTQYVQDRHQDMETVLGKHEIEVITNSYTVIFRTDILSMQKGAVDEIATLDNSIRDTKNAFTELQWRFYNYLTSGVAKGMSETNEKEISPETAEEINSITTELTEVNKMEKPGISVKYIVLGLILAAVLCAFYYFIKYIFCAKLRSVDDLQDIYGLPELGHISLTAEKKKFLEAVDRKILAIRNYGRRQFTTEEAIELTVAAIKIVAEKKEIQNLAMIGCGIKEEKQEICKKIVDRLGKEGIKVNLLNNILYDAVSMEKLTEIQGAVLVGIAEETFYNELLDEKNLLARQEIEQMGIVLIG